MCDRCARVRARSPVCLPGLPPNIRPICLIQRVNESPTALRLRPRARGRRENQRNRGRVIYNNQVQSREPLGGRDRERRPQLSLLLPGLFRGRDQWSAVTVTPSGMGQSVTITDCHSNSVKRLEQIQNPILIFGINQIRLGFKSIPNQIHLPELKSNPIQILKSNP